MLLLRLWLRLKGIVIGLGLLWEGILLSWGTGRSGEGAWWGGEVKVILLLNWTLRLSGSPLLLGLL